MKTFFLGLGAQKAGSTWLHAYLRSSHQGSIEQAKEYHIWDAICIPEFAVSDKRRSQTDRPEMAALRARMMMDQTNYFSHFAKMLESQDVSFAWDITPEYAGLRRDVLVRIRQGFAERNVDTKAIFMMRDPVERAFSAFKMQMVNGNNRFSAFSDDQVLAFLKTPRVAIRCRYDRTIQELDAAFAVSNIYYGLYEEMFTPIEIQRLSKFIGIPQRQGFAFKTFNVTVSDRTFNEEMWQELVQHYRDVYNFAAKRFPSARSRWIGFRYL